MTTPLRSCRNHASRCKCKVQYKNTHWHAM